MEQTGVKHIKKYEVIVSFKEPQQVLIRIEAESPEDAVNRIKKDLESEVTELEFINISELPNESSFIKTENNTIN